MNQTARFSPFSSFLTTPTVVTHGYAQERDRHATAASPNTVKLAWHPPTPGAAFLYLLLREPSLP
jgi:hypothetical protein